MGSASFNYTGGYQFFDVPTGVTSISVVLNGAGSGTVHGGEVRGLLAVKDTDRLCIVVGQAGVPNSGHSGGGSGWGAGGAGGNGYNASGGDGGGGYSAIRMTDSSGTVRCAAGGAGGTSGDGGLGGHGGATTGASGSRGNAGSGATGAATGGTQTQGGNGGTSSSGSQFNGGNASDSLFARAGTGGNTGGYDGPGGGGGGGGLRSGGGGQGGSSGWAPGGGGGGGSSYTYGLTSAQNNAGAGNLGNGNVVLTWNDPAPSNSRPNTPGSLTPASGTRLNAQSVTVKATLTDPNANTVRMRVQLSPSSSFSSYTYYYSAYVASGKQASVTISLPSTNTHYYIRVLAEDSKGAFSLNYASTNFYSNYAPDAPTLTSPVDGYQDSGIDSMVFHWTTNDPDAQPTNSSQVRYMRDSDGVVVATRTVPGTANTYTENPGFFKSNTFYTWQARTQDPSGLWGPWSFPFRFFVAGTATPPRLLYPVKKEALDVAEDNTFTWKFLAPTQGDSQAKADFQYRAVSADDSTPWNLLLGDTTSPGTAMSWTLPGGTFPEGFLYEWQVRTYSVLLGGLTPSDWSDSGYFRSIPSPGASAGDLLPDSAEYQGQLGIGDNIAYLAVKGGQILLGRLTPATVINWGRQRDDISMAQVTLPIQGNKVCELASIVRSWQHEVVVYRTTNGVSRRVWEGPVTRVGYFSDRVEIEARDVMGWPYRRILRQGYNDAYPNTRSVVDRAARILMNALAIDDPNILKYLTVLRFDDDAKQSRIVADWAKTAWEEVDDMAANAGLDYVVVGRRIILFDTSRPIGRLPLMRSKDFDNPPIITEYGMNLATEYGITNNAGVYGSATRDDSFYGPVELLSSAYGEQATSADETLTSAARAALVKTFTDQAKRGIADRWPTPLDVRVPDNSSLRPETNVSMDHLVPGVWIPLQAEHLCRTFSQWQKLDSMKVTQDSSGEQVQVTMSPAPNAGQDPDAESADDSGD